jgi:tubulin monoglycylase TTLL3/8
MKTMNKSYNRSLIVQKYMENPYLYNKRKFDIRTYLLVTTVNGIIKAYFFNEGYIRTTSKEYNLKNL